MGYNTDLCGEFNLDKPLTEAHKNYLNKFSETRRVKRKQTDASKMDDPIRIAAGLPNTPPDGQPSLWCQWVPNDDGTAIVWDGGEKFYEYVDWIKYLVENFFKPWGYVLNGEVSWSGEDIDDRGLIVIQDNVVKIKVARIVYEEVG
jgi:hypothetical protein